MDNRTIQSITTPALLKECYDLAAQSETSDTAREVLREKSRRMDTFPGTPLAQEEPPYQKTTGPGQVSEREFALALSSLQAGTSETQRLQAQRHISAALRDLPNDPRYIAFARMLQEVGS